MTSSVSRPARTSARPMAGSSGSDGRARSSCARRSRCLATGVRPRGSDQQQPGAGLAGAGVRHHLRDRGSDNQPAAGRPAAASAAGARSAEGVVAALAIRPSDRARM